MNKLAEHKISRWIRVCMLSMCLAALIGCAPSPTVSLELRVDQESDSLTISVFNQGRLNFLIDGQLLDASKENDIALEVVSISNKPIERCKGIDYIGTADETLVLPGRSEDIRLSLLAISMSHCLVEKDEYKIRAVMKVPYGPDQGKLISTRPATFIAPSAIAEQREIGSEK